MPTPAAHSAGHARQELEQSLGSNHQATRPAVAAELQTSREGLIVASGAEVV